MHLLPGLFKKKRVDVFLGVSAVMPGPLKMGRTLSVNMQPLCSSQCVVQRCSQTPKHVLLKLYDCTYCLLFYNHCKILSRMSNGNIVIDVIIYLVANFFFFLPFIGRHVHLFQINLGILCFFCCVFFVFFVVLNKACPVWHPWTVVFLLFKA